MTIEKKLITEYSLIAFVDSIVQAVKDGYEIDPKFAPNLYGYIYEVGVVKNSVETTSVVTPEPENKPAVDFENAPVVKRSGRPKKVE